MTSKIEKFSHISAGFLTIDRINAKRTKAKLIADFTRNPSELIKIRNFVLQLIMADSTLHVIVEIVRLWVRVELVRHLFDDIWSSERLSWNSFHLFLAARALVFLLLYPRHDAFEAEFVITAVDFSAIHLLNLLKAYTAGWQLFLLDLIDISLLWVLTLQRVLFLFIHVLNWQDGLKGQRINFKFTLPHFIFI